MFGLLEVFMGRVQDQTREFDNALARCAARRMATVCKMTVPPAVLPPEPAGLAPASTELTPPDRGSASRRQGRRAKPKLNFA